MTTDITHVTEFLGCETPDAWVQAALQQQEVLLIDHANCEKKAASTALNLMYRYVDKYDLLQKMSRLAREELRHFEQVVRIMKQRGVAYRHLEPSRYASGLRRHVRAHEPAKLVDVLITGALIEARSCERFACLMPHLDESLSDFYGSLLKSESRHFEDYLKLAKKWGDADEVEQRIALFREAEAELVLSADEQFRFHSGVPA